MLCFTRIMILVENCIPQTLFQKNLKLETTILELKNIKILQIVA